MKKKIILGASIGNCVHVAGLYHFLKIAETEGFGTIFLGPAVPLKRLIEEIEKSKPDIVALSYRLTPENAFNLFKELDEMIKAKGIKETEFIFGGTRPAAEMARKFPFFKQAFSGEESMDEIKEFLRGGKASSVSDSFPQTLIERINKKYPYPLIRHHFGRPSIADTITGAKIIAESEVVDIISLGTDQNAQEHFFNPEDMIPSLNGAGGVPVRSRKDLADIYNASRCGNFPLMRCYSGTNNLQKWAEMSVDAIHNAWAAIPLTWYSVIDGRSKRTLAEAITENRSVMKWYASKGIPVEVNESHQWSLRDAHDAVAVAMAYLAAYNAKSVGVNNYVAQYMFNTPPGTYPSMDLAKMLAKKEMIYSLHDSGFTSYTEVRAGIAHFSPDEKLAKGQLAASAVISLSLKPHILHVVGFSEGHHAIFPEELIESCKIVHGVLNNCLNGLPDYSSDPVVIKRKEELKMEAGMIIDAVRQISKTPNVDPLTDPVTLAAAIKEGILDAPHFRGNPHLCGNVVTQLIDGAWYAINPSDGKKISEKDRLNLILNKGDK